MAIFTFDDLNELERNEAEMFGPFKEQSGPSYFSPDRQSLDMIRNYSQSLSTRESEHLGMLVFHIN